MMYSSIVGNCCFDIATVSTFTKTVLQNLQLTHNDRRPGWGFQAILSTSRFTHPFIASPPPGSPLALFDGSFYGIDIDFAHLQ
jgi:hypothetical protein